MAVICFSSLKGGVGKTTLSVSVASAFAERGCQTLLIDLDPAEHATNFFQVGSSKRRTESPLARLFLANQSEGETERSESLIEAAMAAAVPLIVPVRSRLALLPAGPELRHFLWGRGSRAFKTLFPQLLEELGCSYDYIVIDTAPDFNVLTRNSIAVADLVVVPIDTSVMSINCLEQLVSNCAHIQGPVWSIIRTMVTRQASRVQQLSAERLHANLALCSSDETDEDEFDDFIHSTIDDENDLISLIDQNKLNGNSTSLSVKPQAHNESPIFLLNSVVYRSEQQNKLTFLGKTAFDSRSSSKLADQYMLVARELEQIMTLQEESEALMPMDDFLPQMFSRAHAS